MPPQILSDEIIDKMIKLRLTGRSYREIAELVGAKNFHNVHYWVRKYKVDRQSVWDISNAAELSTWLSIRKELHVHRQAEGGKHRGRYQWRLVERRTSMCGTNQCLKVKTV